MRGWFVIRKMRKPTTKGVDEDLEWFCRSVGLLGGRDRERTGLKIFKLLLTATRDGTPLTIDEIARKTNLSRTAVAHHLKTMRALGLVVGEGQGYYIREANLENLVDELFLDVERTIKNIREIAEDIDKAFGMPTRDRE
ncbi:MAG: helix-turn-helix transcriptional regulator [Candidatus Diapherotrites archaeon]|nr:helix-turn-helix transcriptional regulator [Candidatus Diapherotrites archaeon]